MITCSFVIELGGALAGSTMRTEQASFVEVLTIPVFGFLFLQQSSYEGAWWMIPLVLLAGSIGIAGVGTLLATMSVNTKGKDFVLAVALRWI